MTEQMWEAVPGQDSLKRLGMFARDTGRREWGLERLAGTRLSRALSDLGSIPQVKKSLGRLLNRESQWWL